MMRILLLTEVSPHTLTLSSNNALQALKELFYGNKDYPSPSILISSLRGRLLPHMLPARPLLVDHVLNPVNTPELVALR
jgi:hypothetical protein